MTKKKTSLDTKFYFDEQSALRVRRFFEKFLRHTKGRWAGLPFQLQEWQWDDVVKPLFGWKRTDGTRRYRTAYIELPRKNGKSTLSAGLGLYGLFADNEPGAEIYSAAADREQAAIVFEQARNMVEQSSELSKRAEVYKRSIVVPATGSTYKVLSADAYTKHGLNAHMIIFDELHAQPNRDLWDVLSTSTGSRAQPLMVAITTAGFDRNSICWEQHEYARQINAGIIEDETYFGYIAAADEEDDWTKEETWQKANPGYDVTISAEYLRNEARKAENIPAYQNTFRRLHLNQWTQQESRWLDTRKWDECSAEPPELDGRECYAGLDMATHTDIAAFVMIFPPVDDGEPHHVVTRFFIPNDNMVERSRTDRVPYEAWCRDGYIISTEGNVIDYQRIQAEIEALGKRYNIREIAFDRWGAFQISQNLEGAGFKMIPFGQGFASMSAPTKELLRLVLERNIAHGGNPVLRWMADNMVVKTDPAGNVKPDKSKSREKIDGMVALVMALDRAIRHGNDGNVNSVYNRRGVLVI